MARASESPPYEGPPIHIQDRGDLIVVTYYTGATDEQYEEYLLAMDRILERNRARPGGWVVINDATRWYKSNANQRKMQADWMKKHTELMRERTAGVAFVIDNALVRGGLTAVLWLAPLPCPHCIVKTLGEATEWARERLEAPVSKLA